jgi:hypothetical protein
MSRIAFILLVGTTVLSLWHYYLWARLVRDTKLPPRWRRALTVLIFGMVALMPLTVFLFRELSLNLAGLVGYIVFSWIGLAIMLLVGVALGDLVKLLRWIGRKASARPEPDEARRAFLARVSGGVVAGVSASVAAYGIDRAFRGRVVERSDIKLKNFPASLAGLSIAQLTDIHIGPTLRRGFLQGLVDETNALGADIIVITGDLVDGSVAQLREHVAPLAQLKAPRGVFFVTGNHDYYSGADDWCAELTRLGIRPLRNENVRIGEGDEFFTLAGVEDFMSANSEEGHGRDLDKALSGRDSARPVVLLAHQPRTLPLAVERGVDLQLSGHTHGGQIFPWGLLVMLQQPVVAGLVRRAGTQIYVSRGSGFWGPPMRVGSLPEIALLSLHPAPEAAPLEARG